LKKNNRGFTLAELLIVVAIIAVLVAIAIPVFSTQLEKSRESTDLANIRSAYAEAITEYLTTNGACTVKVTLKQTQDTWQYVETEADGSVVIGTAITANVSGAAAASGSATGTVKVEGQPKQNYVCTITVGANGIATAAIAAS